MRELPTPTAYKTKSILDAIAECERYIAKESPRPADTRPEYAVRCLAHAIAHRTKLLAMLQAAA